MKRFILGMGWFTIISFVLTFIGAIAVGFIAGTSANSIVSGAKAGGEAGARFNQQYGLIIIIVSAIIAIIGTMTGKLPYTQKDKTIKK